MCHLSLAVYVPPPWQLPPAMRAGSSFPCPPPHNSYADLFPSATNSGAIVSTGGQQSRVRGWIPFAGTVPIVFARRRLVLRRRGCSSASSDLTRNGDMCSAISMTRTSTLLPQGPYGTNALCTFRCTIDEFGGRHHSRCEMAERKERSTGTCAASSVGVRGDGRQRDGCQSGAPHSP